MGVVDELLQEWAKAGYPGARINLWEKKRLYVSIPGSPPFCYQLDKPLVAARLRIHPIQSSQYLDGKVFRSARGIGMFVAANKGALINALADGRYVSAASRKGGAVHG